MLSMSLKCEYVAREVGIGLDSILLTFCLKFLFSNFRLQVFGEVL